MTKTLPKTSFTWAAGLFIGFFLVLGYLHIRDYSRTVDELRVMERGQLSWKLAKSLLGAGAPLTSEESEKLATHFHPPLFGLLNWPVSVFSSRHLPLDPVESLHVLPLLWSGLGLFFLFQLAARMFNPEVGFYSVLFLICLPRFVSHAQYNPKDVPAMMASILAAYRFYVALENKSVLNFLGAGICLGLACALGLNGLLLIPVMIGAYALDNYFKSEEKKILEKEIRGSRLIFLSIYLLSAISFFYLSWPQTWQDPFFPFRALNHFSGTAWFEMKDSELLWFGKRIYSLELPWSYTIINVLITTPVMTVLMSATGFLSSWTKLNKKTSALHFILAGWFLFPILVRSQMGIFRYSDMRHVFISIPPMMIYGALGLQLIINYLKVRWIRFSVLFSLGLPLLVFVPLVRTLSAWHPFQGSYYNEFIQWKYPRHIEDHLLIIPWGESCRQVSDWINQNAESHSTWHVQCEGYMEDYGLRPDLISVSMETADAIVLTADKQRWYEDKGFPRSKAFYIEERMGSGIFYVFKRGANGF